MKWAFWRADRRRGAKPGRAEPRRGIPSDALAGDEPAFHAAQAARVRVRMRQRLIGAAALLLGAAVLVPMMLDPTPRPLPDNIPIDIPSERTPFAPRLSLPADAKPAEAKGGEPVPTRSAGEAVDEPAYASDAAGASGATAGASGTAPDAAAGKPLEVAPAAPHAAQASPAEARSAKAEWFVQAAAFSSESAARQLSDRLAKAGLSPFVQRTDSAGSVLYRVRLGPFPAREDAVRARRHLHAMGVGSNVIRVEQVAR